MNSFENLIIMFILFFRLATLTEKKDMILNTCESVHFIFASQNLYLSNS